MTLKKKRNILIATSWVLRVLPLLVVFCIKFKSWVNVSTNTTTSYFSLSVGAIMTCILIFLAVIDKLPKPNGLMFPMIIFVILLCFNSILDDLVLLWGMYCIGGLLSYIVDWFIKRYNYEIAKNDQADTTTEKIRNVLTEMLGDKGE